MAASPSALWQRYLLALRTHPIRTRMITSGCLFATGDAIAQGGIEGRDPLSSFRRSSRTRDDTMDEVAWDVSLSSVPS